METLFSSQPLKKSILLSISFLLTAKVLICHPLVQQIHLHNGQKIVSKIVAYSRHNYIFSYLNSYHNWQDKLHLEQLQQENEST